MRKQKFKQQQQQKHEFNMVHPGSVRGGSSHYNQE